MCVLESESCPNVSKHWRGTKFSLKCLHQLPDTWEAWSDRPRRKFETKQRLLNSELTIILYRWRCMIIFRKIWSTLTNGTLIIIPWCALKKICSELEKKKKNKRKETCKVYLFSSFFCYIQFVTSSKPYSVGESPLVTQWCRIYFKCIWHTIGRCNRPSYDPWPLALSLSHRLWNLTIIKTFLCDILPPNQ